jgi:non-heme chloroperoxidase
VFLTGFTTDFREELKAIAIPSLIVHGTHDVQAPIDICGRKVAQLVPNNRFVEYDNAAHGLFVTHARRLNEDLAAFIDGRLAESHAVDGKDESRSVAPVAV